MFPLLKRWKSTISKILLEKLSTLTLILTLCSTKSDLKLNKKKVRNKTLLLHFIQFKISKESKRSNLIIGLSFYSIWERWCWSPHTTKFKPAEDASSTLRYQNAWMVQTMNDRSWDPPRLKLKVQLLNSISIKCLCTFSTTLKIESRWLLTSPILRRIEEKS